MAHIIEGVFPDAWLPTGKKYLNEMLARDINRTMSAANPSPSGWSDDEEGIFREQGLEPSHVVEYERLVLARARKHGTTAAPQGTSAEFRAWADDGQLLKHWSSGKLEGPDQPDIP